MIKKIITLSFIAWAIAAIWSTSPAKAVVAISGLKDIKDITELTEVVPTPVYTVTATTLNCDDGRQLTFSYLQLMGIPGFGRVWAPVDQVYNAGGPQDAVLIGTCIDGGTTYYFYDLGDCNC